MCQYICPIFTKSSPIQPFSIRRHLHRQVHVCSFRIDHFLIATNKKNNFLIVNSSIAFILVFLKMCLTVIFYFVLKNLWGVDDPN